jgi:hypothetical protein
VVAIVIGGDFVLSTMFAATNKADAQLKRKLTLCSGELKKKNNNNIKDIYTRGP